MDVSQRARHTRENSIGWMIQRLARQLDVAMNAQLAEHGLTLPQFAILMTVLEHEPLTQADIGRHFAMPAYAISRVLDGLEEAGMIVRAAHPQSRRAHQINATDKGRAFAPELFAIVGRVNATLTEPLDDADRETLKRLLDRVLTNRPDRGCQDP